MNPIQPTKGDALLLIDMQLDFLPGGKLGVPNGDQVIAPIQRLLHLFSAQDLPVYASRDWHPGNHCSFSARGGPWPPHCVAGTEGAEFAPQLDLPLHAVVVSKADSADIDAYSAFNGTGLAVQLRECGVRRVVVAGLATDYCVLNTVIDARENGFDVIVVLEAVRAVDVAPGDGERALARMAALGAKAASIDDFAGMGAPA
jgi:nicotinamidase/pyrazinamidase